MTTLNINYNLWPCHPLFSHLFYWTQVRSLTCHVSQGQVALPKRINFRKSSKGGVAHFQSKNLCCTFWTLKRGFRKGFFMKKNKSRVGHCILNWYFQFLIKKNILFCLFWTLLVTFWALFWFSQHQWFPDYWIELSFELNQQNFFWIE